MASLAQGPFSRVSIENEAANAYDAVGPLYRAYADGDVRRLFDFSSRYSFADREIWQRIDRLLIKFRASGKLSLRVADAGCGPGTWLLRVVLRAQELGFEDIVAFGFDISPAMVDLACGAARDLPGKGTCLTFHLCDIEDGLRAYLAEPADLVLCLYGVLNHLPKARHGLVAGELARATDGSLLVTARTIGSLPSIFVAGVEEARDFRHDHCRDRLAVDLRDGRHIEFNFHLFSASEFEHLFEGEGDIAELVGLDLFHGRFNPDSRWNPPGSANQEFDDALVSLEHSCAADPRFMDRAAHILVHLHSNADRS